MKNEVRVALLLDKSAAYDRGLIRGIVNNLDPDWQWSFFFENPYHIIKSFYKKVIRDLFSWRPDFIVTNDTSLIPKLKELNVPIFATPSNHKIKDVINIIADDEKIGQIGAKHFINSGFNNLAFYGSDRIFWSKSRRIAFRDMALSHGLNYFEEEASLSKNWQKNPYRLQKWIESLPKPVGIMACQDDFALQVTEAANLAEANIPFDVAVLGVDNDFFLCNLYKPSLSSIDQEPESVGLKVARAIQEGLIDENQLPEEIMGNNYHIIPRLSSEVTAIADEELRKAVLFIKENIEFRDITVNDVMEVTCLSRRSLEMRFRNVLNQSIKQVITRERLKIACQKLRNSDLSVNEIAYSLGFSSPSSFSSFFKKEKGCSCKDYQQQF